MRAPTETSPTLPRVPNGRALILFLLINAVVLTAGILIGRGMSTTESEAARTAEKSISTTAAVEQRTVGRTVTAQGEVHTGTEVSFTPDLSGDRSIVTSTHLSLGDPLQPGRMIAAVSDRPIITIPHGVRLYRDLQIDDDGSDARALNQTLRSWGYDAPTGDTWTRQSHDAFTSFLKRQNYEASEDQPVRWKDFYTVPSAEDANSLTLERIAETGQELSDQTPLLTARSGSSYISARTDLGTADSLREGDEIQLQNEAQQNTPARIIGISEFKEGENPGKDLTIELPEGFQAPESGKVVIQITPDVPETLAVPLTAVRTAQGEESVTLAEDGRNIPVRILRQADGWAALEDAPELSAGDDVIIRR